MASITRSWAWAQARQVWANQAITHQLCLHATGTNLCLQVEALPGDFLEDVEPGVTAILRVIRAHLREEAQKLGLASLQKQQARANKAVNAAQSRLARHEATAAMLQQDEYSDMAQQEAKEHVKAAQHTLRKQQHEQHALSASLSHVHNKLDTLRQKLAACVHAKLQGAAFEI